MVLRDIPVPEIGEDDALVRVTSSGTCRTDRHLWNGTGPTMTAVEACEIDTYRNLEPKSMIPETKGTIKAVWNKNVRDGLGTRPACLQKSSEMKPETPIN